MRRKEREINSKDEIIKIIKEERICRLVMKDEPYPYIVPLNYGIELDGEYITLYFHSANEGRKIDLLRKDNHVAFEIDRNQGVVYDTDKGSCSMLYESVIGNGNIEFVEGDEKLRALRLILRHNGRGEDFPINEAICQRTSCFKLLIKEFTGKKH